jgi:integrase
MTPTPLILNALSKQQLTDYFSNLLDSHSWSTVKLDLYGLKFYYAHVLDRPWVNIDLIKPPKAQRLPDIVTVEEAGRLFAATHKLSYRVFYFTVYSLGLRLGEGLRLQVGDIDAVRRRVHIRINGVRVIDCVLFDMPPTSCPHHDLKALDVARSWLRSAP